MSLLLLLSNGSAVVTPSVTALTPAITIEVELSGAGNGWTVITPDVEALEGLRIKHGITGSAPIDLVASTGTCQFTLRNDAGNSGGLAGYYSLFHTNTRSGWALGIGCRVRITNPAFPTIYTRFRGRIDRIAASPGVHLEQRVRVLAVDFMDELARWQVSVHVGEQSAKTDDQILTAMLAQMPSQPAATSFDVGQDAYPYALDTSGTTPERGLQVCAKLSASGLGRIFTKADGTFRYENRNTRLVNTSSTWVIGDDTLPADVGALTLPSSRDEILNSVCMTVHPRRVDEAATTVVYALSTPIFLTTGVTKTFTGSYRDPATGLPIGATEIQSIALITAPEYTLTASGTDYAGYANQDGSGTNLTAGLTVTVVLGPSQAEFTVTNSGADAWLTTLQLRGKGVYDHGATQLKDFDDDSIDAYGERAVNYDMPYQGSEDVGQAGATYFLSSLLEPFAQVRSVRVLGMDAATLTQLLTRDISDRVTVQETLTGVDGPFFINGEDFRVLPNGLVEATYTLAPAIDPFGGIYWQLGMPGYSELGTTTGLGF